MTRRTFLAALAGLPFVGELFAGAAPEFAPGVVEEAFVASNPIYFVGMDGWWQSGGGDGVLRWSKISDPLQWPEDTSLPIDRHFETVAEAVEAAGPGTSIFVASGHQEHVDLGGVDTYDFVFGGESPLKLNVDAWRKS